MVLFLVVKLVASKGIQKAAWTAFFLVDLKVELKVVDKVA
jgi:hypothetical protein